MRVGWLPVSKINLLHRRIRQEHRPIVTKALICNHRLGERLDHTVKIDVSNFTKLCVHFIVQHVEVVAALCINLHGDHHIGRSPIGFLHAAPYRIFSAFNINFHHANVRQAQRIHRGLWASDKFNFFMLFLLSSLGMFWRDQAGILGISLWYGQFSRRTLVITQGYVFYFHARAKTIDVG
jgi:hypothetical protein